MKNTNSRRNKLSFALALMMLLTIFAQNAYARGEASHTLGTGGKGTTVLSIFNPRTQTYTTLGDTINNHRLSYSYIPESINGIYINQETHEAFCMSPYSTNDDNYSRSTYSGRDYQANYDAATKFICMYYDGYPTGGSYTDQQRKVATQVAIFNTSYLGTSNQDWYVRLYNTGPIRQCTDALIDQADSYPMPATSAELGKPSNITNVRLTYNSSTNTYTATVNAGPNAKYYTWNDGTGYVSLNGNNLTFTVPASEISSWTGTYNGNPAYTSKDINGEGNSTRIAHFISWWPDRGAAYQEMLTVDFFEEKPTNTVQYSLYVNAADEGRPGAGGGYYGGTIATDSAVAGGGSGYVGTGSNVVGGSSMAGNNTIPDVPDGSNDGYARITLVN